MPNKDNHDSLDSKIKNLSKKERIKKAKIFADQFCVGLDSMFNLKFYKTNIDTDFDEKSLDKTLELGVSTLSNLQEILYAQDKWSLLIIFQAMDAAGKDGAIKHVMSGVNPQGCQVSSFKTPSSEELDHDYLWRCQKHLPERGRIGIFNRSYYEEVLVVKVHKQILDAQKLPKEMIAPSIWEERYEDIANFEKHLHRNGTKVIKFFLNVSKEEQKNRFIERIEDPDKNWKFSPSDVKERGFWDDYMTAYQDLIQHTSTEDSPWYVIPADNKSYARIVIASAIIKALDEMKLEYPKVDDAIITELNEIKKTLLAE